MNQIVLIAEGDPELCDVFRRILLLRGYEAEIAQDGLDCVEKLRELRPALLVLDRELRWGGGDGVLAWLREKSDMSGVPVVLTATSDIRANGSDALEPPIVKFLPKPFALSALLESVHAVIASTEREEAPNLPSAVACSEIFIG